MTNKANRIKKRSLAFMIIGRVVYHRDRRVRRKIPELNQTMSASTAQLETHDALLKKLREIVGRENVLSDPDQLLVYECDGLPQHKHPPRAVVFPTSTEETSEILRLLANEGVSFAPRGAGTGLSGGALAIDRGGVVGR